ncbi:sensor histidine kinase [Streptomyces sp. NPDC002446]
MSTAAYRGGVQFLHRLGQQLRSAPPPLRDLMVTAGCFTLAAPVAVGTAYHDHASLTGAVAALAVSCLPLTVRSRWPLAVAVTTVAIHLAQLVLLPLPRPTPAATAVALYTVARRSSRRRAWLVGMSAATVLITTSLIFRPGLENLPQAIALIAWTLTPVALGDAVRSRRQVLAAATERAERAERTKEEEARRRVTAERLRIARELHDVVAHHITLVNAQAGVAHHLMRTDPDHAYQALERIRDTSRAALDELRTTVGLLRYSEDAVAPREPTPSLASLDDLLDSFRHCDLTISLTRTGEAGQLAPITDLAAYRIIQEALTNTRKHAGPTSARIHLDYLPDALRLTIEDDGPRITPHHHPAGANAATSTNPLTGTGTGTGSGTGTGHGMIGMRERAKAAGGTLTAGPDPGKGFRIDAELPLRPGRKG